MARFKGKTKFNWDKPGLKRLVGEAAAKALQNAGMDCRRSVQRQMVGSSTPSGRRPRKNPVFRQYGTKDGIPLVGAIYRVAREDKVSSWAPMAFLRNDIQTDYDNTTKSVVIGPSKEPWINQLHEFGGTVHVYVNHGQYPSKTFRRRKLPRSLQGKNGAYVGMLSNVPYGTNSTYIGTRSVNGRGYMEIGLQAMIHRIPRQFQDTIRSSGGSLGR